MATMNSINEFVSLKNLAIVGVSRNQKKFGNSLYRSLKQKGYNVFPVNNSVDQIDGEKCYPDLKSLPSEAEGVVIVVPPETAKNVVQEAVQLGIKNIWMQQGSESKEAIAFCEEKKINVVGGECLLMFIPQTEFFHRFHKGINRIFGKLPK